MDGRQPGDPAKAAQAILEALNSDDPPLRLALGNDAVDSIRGRHEQLRTDLDGWEKLSRSTDLSWQPVEVRHYFGCAMTLASWCVGRAGRIDAFGEACFEVGDAPVLEAEVGAGGLEPLVEGAVVGGELTDPLFERGVLVVIRWMASSDGAQKSPLRRASGHIPSLSC
jgi:hypothetical protein